MNLASNQDNLCISNHAHVRMRHGAITVLILCKANRRPLRQILQYLVTPS